MEEQLKELLRADPDLVEVSADPDVMDGLPVIRGTRIPVSFVLELLEEGYEEAGIRSEFPTLPPGCVRVALRFARRLASLR